MYRPWNIVAPLGRLFEVPQHALLMLLPSIFATTFASTSNTGFLPHGYCYLWNKPLLWTHVLSDALIGISYVIISCSLALFLYRMRREIPFSFIVLEFGAFIIACGMTHFMDVWTLWQPYYWLAGGVKVVTAAASVTTAAILPFMVPKIQDTIRDAQESGTRRDAAVRAQELEEQVNRRTTELRVALVAAEDASRAKSEFLATMSHELRTPLNSIIGFANVLTKNKAQSLRIDDVAFAERIQVNGKHLLTLINSILDLSKIESGHVETEITEVAIGPLIHDVVTQLEGVTRDRSVQLVVDLPECIRPLATDDTKMRQILVNLLGNALKFTDQGSVTVRVVTDEATAAAKQIDVIDTGIGIPADRIDAVFHPFEQADNSTARKYGGTGLGLAITRSLCELLGAKLTVSSAVGEGSTFSIVLAGR